MYDYTYLSLYFQYGLGPAQIGVMFLIPSAIIIIMAPLVGHLIDVYPVSSLILFSTFGFVTLQLKKLRNFAHKNSAIFLLQRKDRQFPLLLLN